MIRASMHELRVWASNEPLVLNSVLEEGEEVLPESDLRTADRRIWIITTARSVCGSWLICLHGLHSEPLSC
jgi:hypothetical protein